MLWVHERRAIEIAPNDKLLLMANRHEPSFRAINGELFTVSRIDDQGPHSSAVAASPLRIADN
jgi:hypothetical protein